MNEYLNPQPIIFFQTAELSFAFVHIITIYRERNELLFGRLKKTRKWGLIIYQPKLFDNNKNKKEKRSIV